MNAILLYPVLFGTALAWYYKKFSSTPRLQTNLLGIGMISYVFVFAILACVFYFHPDFSYSSHYGTGHTYIMASIFLFGAYMILLYPFLKNDYGNFKHIVITNEFEWLITIVAISSFLEALLLFPRAISGLSAMSIDLTGLREDASEAGNVGSGITSIPVLLYSFFSTILPVSFFYYLIRGTSNKKLLFLGIATFLVPVMSTLATGSREHFVFPLIDVIIAYLIFYRFLSKKSKHVLNLILSTIGVSIFLMSAWMSLMRFINHNEYDGTFFLVKYLGEGFVNFNTLLFHELDNVDPCYGDYNFAIIRQIFGLDYSATNDFRREYWGMRLPFPTSYFYSIIGAIVIDWGKIGGLIVCLIIARVTYAFTKIKGEIIGFSQIIALHFVATICAKGVFFFNYCSLFGGRTIIVMIILCLFMRKREKLITCK